MAGNGGNGTIIRRLFRLFVVICARFVVLVLLYPRHGRRRFGAVRDQWLADTVVAMGPAFVKAAQLLSARADVLPPRACDALARLYDRVRPRPGVRGPAAVTVLRMLGLPAATATLIGSGSIADVYGVSLADGREVAVKVRRPGVEQALTADLVLLDRLARLAARTPMLRGVPVTEIVTEVCDAIRAQLDLVREASFLDELRRSMGAMPDVTIPAVDHELSTEDVLVMELVPDLLPRTPAEFADAAGKRAVRTALQAVYRMLFLDGVVHCDLHPGNLYPRPDGTVVIVDAGFTVRLSDTARERFAAFFYCMSQGDGPACADIVLSTARSVPGSDVERFRAELTALVSGVAGLPASEFDLVGFATSLFDLQRRHGFYADPQFVFPILSLLVVEGVVRRFDPDVDFQRVAAPFLAMALFESVGRGV